MIPDTETVQWLREQFLSGALVHALTQHGVPEPARAEALALADLAESAAEIYATLLPRLLAAPAPEAHEALVDLLLALRHIDYHLHDALSEP